MKIGICDDELIVREILMEKIEACLKILGGEAEIIPFISGAAVLPKSKTLDILFLDIEMPEMDGIKVGKMMHQRNPKCKIIIATSKAERIKEGFYIQAHRFITKPFLEEEIKEAIESCMKASIGKKTIVVYENRIPYEVMQCDIKYVEAYDSYCEFGIGKERMRKETSLQKLEELLEQEIFCRVSRKYIVNLLLIETYMEGVVETGGKRIEVSRRNRKIFEKRYYECDLKYR